MALHPKLITDISRDLLQVLEGYKDHIQLTNALIAEGFTEQVLPDGFTAPDSQSLHIELVKELTGLLEYIGIGPVEEVTQPIALPIEGQEGQE